MKYLLVLIALVLTSCFAETEDNHDFSKFQGLMPQSYRPSVRPNFADKEAARENPNVSERFSGFGIPLQNANNTVNQYQLPESLNSTDVAARAEAYRSYISSIVSLAFGCPNL